MHPSSYDEMKINLIKYTNRFQNKEANVVDLGSFDVNGTYKPLMNPLWKYIGVDITEGRNVDVVMPNHNTIPITKDSVDILISGQCLEHVQRPWLLFQEIYRIVKNSGVILIVCPAKYHLHNDPKDYWRIYPDGLQTLIEDVGFKTINVYTNPKDGLSEQNYNNPHIVDCWGIAVKEPA